MAYRMATKECSVCHYRKPANEMHKKTISQASGSSVGIYGLGKGSKAKGSVRQYYRKKDVWICESCMEERFSIRGFIGLGKKKLSSTKTKKERSTNERTIVDVVIGLVGWLMILSLIILIIIAYIQGRY